jgi:hypothetical protein
MIRLKLPDYYYSSSFLEQEEGEINRQKQHTRYVSRFLFIQKKISLY